MKGDLAPRLSPGRAARYCVQSFAAVSAAAVVYGGIRTGRLSFAHVFPFNFAAGAAVILVGIVLLARPVLLLGKKDVLIDHSNYAQRVQGARAEKRAKAIGIILFGTAMLAQSAVLQLALSLIIPHPRL